jgi:hypothetical protein
MCYWETLSPHAQSIWKWIAHETTKQSAPPSLGAALWPNLRSENRAAPAEQPKPNVSMAETMWPNLRRKR